MNAPSSLLSSNEIILNGMNHTHEHSKCSSPVCEPDTPIAPLTAKSQFTLSGHAIKRMAQRGITHKMITDTIEHGHCIRKQQIAYYIMLNKCIPKGVQPTYRSRISGCTVLVNCLNEVVTVYKNPKALKELRKKSDYRHLGLYAYTTKPVNQKDTKNPKSRNKKAVSPNHLVNQPERLSFSKAAFERCKSVGLSIEDIALILKHGRKKRAAGGCAQFIMESCGGMLQYPIEVRTRTIGWYVILTPCGKVIKLGYGKRKRRTSLQSMIQNVESQAA